MYQLPNVIGMKIYESGDVIVIREGRTPPRTQVNGKKKPLYYLSAKARTNMLFTLKNTQILFYSMFCLSYPDIYPQSGKVVKRHLNRWLVAYRRAKPGVPYFWFLEFQKRGAPHIHVYLGDETEHHSQPEMARQWANIASGGDAQTWGKVYHVHCHPKQFQDFLTREGAIRYAAKYALKTRQKSVPKEFSDVGRFWGCSRVVRERMDEGQYVDISERAIQEHLYATNHRCKAWDITPKVIFDCFT